MLINENGMLKVVEINDALKQFRNSYQGVWSDFDDDGDADLYVTNDFAPDVFLENETTPLSDVPKFSVATEKLVPNGGMGYGMGASWGDYDADGKLDLYVSNMYSKAGNRIIQHLGEVDPRISFSAKGNFLFRKKDGVFEQVAGKKENDIHVSKVGWSFGGQFSDFNNDSHLDLYVPSGFYTSPAVSDTDKDL